MDYLDIDVPKLEDKQKALQQQLLESYRPQYEQAKLAVAHLHALSHTNWTTFDSLVQQNQYNDQRASILQVIQKLSIDTLIRYQYYPFVNRLLRERHYEKEAERIIAEMSQLDPIVPESKAFAVLKTIDQLKYQSLVDKLVLKRTAVVQQIRPESLGLAQFHQCLCQEKEMLELLELPITLLDTIYQGVCHVLKRQVYGLDETLKEINLVQFYEELIERVCMLPLISAFFSDYYDQLVKQYHSYTFDTLDELVEQLQLVNDVVNDAIPLSPVDKPRKSFDPMAQLAARFYEELALLPADFTGLVQKINYLTKVQFLGVDVMLLECQDSLVKMEVAKLLEQKWTLQSLSNVPLELGAKLAAINSVKVSKQVNQSILQGFLQQYPHLEPTKQQVKLAIGL